MSPAKIAIALAVTIAASAGTGGMKNVIGTSSAVAMVAVRPGRAPTNRPKAEARHMTISTCGSAISARAASSVSTQSPEEFGQQPARQRDAQQIGECDLEGERGGDRDQRRLEERNPLAHEQHDQHGE